MKEICEKVKKATISNRLSELTRALEILKFHDGIITPQKLRKIKQMEIEINSLLRVK